MAAAADGPPAPPTIVNDVLWRKIAGARFSLPPLNSSVLYFPQGHIEQCSDAGFRDNHGNLPINRPFILCQVTSTQLLSHPLDEIFVRYSLKPIDGGDAAGVAVHSGYQADDVDAMVKELSQTDVRGHSRRFFVPKSIGMAIFPPLDMDQMPPEQTLKITDVHGTQWKFRHIYNQRHLIFSGWRRFAKAKSLVPGDFIVFMKKRSTEQLFVGIRRSCKVGGNSREEVLSAMERAARGSEFQVDCYPRAELPAFVVNAEKVVEASRTHWEAGMTIQIEMESETVPKLDRFQGTVQAVELPQTGPWLGSPWRMLQVDWLYSSKMEDFKTVNPWDVIQDLLSLRPIKKAKHESLPDTNLDIRDNDNQLLFIRLLNGVMGLVQRSSSLVQED